MVDPDAPSRDNPTAAQWLHWLVVNIPGRREILGLKSSHIINIYSGSDLSAGDVSLGKVLMQHNGPSPPQNSGLYKECFQFFFKS